MFVSSKILHTLYSLTDAERLSQINTTQYSLLGNKIFIRIHLSAKYLGVILDDSCISCIFSILHSYYLALLASWKFTILEFNPLANIPSWNFIILENYHLGKCSLGKFLPWKLTILEFYYLGKFILESRTCISDSW